MKGLIHGLMACLVVLCLAVPSQAAPVTFDYTQTEMVIGSGTITGDIDLSPWGGSGVVTFTGVLPPAIVIQNDLNTGFPVPFNAVGFITNGSNANPGSGVADAVGVYLDLSGPPITLTGMDGPDTWTIDVPRVMTSGLAYSYNFTLFDDPFGAGDVTGDYQFAGWPGDNGAGHRHTGDTRTFNVGQDMTNADANGALGGNASGDNLGFMAGLRAPPDAPPPPPFPIFVDDITFGGELDADESTLLKNGAPPPPPVKEPVLFIGGGGEPTSGADAAAYTFLRDRYGPENVRYEQASTATTADADGRQLLVLSSTFGSGDARGKFDAVAVGIVNWEEALADDSAAGEFFMAETINKVTSDPVRIDVTNTAHPIANGVGPGVIDFTTGNAETFYGENLGPGVTSIGNQDTDVNQKAILIADVGDQLVGGGTSPNRRVMFGMTDDTFNSLSPAGLRLFGQSADWAGNLTPLAAQPPELIWYSMLDGNANDEIGGVNGVLNGDTTATADRDGNAGAALLFDGDADNVVIDKSTLPASFTEGSITAWARVDLQANDTGVVGVGGSGGGSTEYFNIILAGGGDNYRADVDRGGSGNDSRVDAQDGNSIDDQWHHLAMTFQVDDGLVRLFVDGVQVNADGLSTDTPLTPTNDWTIGSDRLTDRFFTGAIDDVAIWGTMLTDSEILSLANGTETPLSLAQGGQAVVPEPSTWALLVLGGAGLLLWRRRRAPR